MESELPIPMPEIPGYKPPEKQERNSESSPPPPMASAPSGYNSVYGDGVRRRLPIPLARPQQPNWQQTHQDWHNYYAMLQSYPVVSQPHVNVMYGIIPNRPVATINSYSYNTQYTATPPLQLPLPPRAKTPPREVKSLPSEDKEEDSSKSEWLECKIKDDPFGLVGETLLCPIKVTLCILQELFRKKE